MEIVFEEARGRTSSVKIVGGAVRMRLSRFARGEDRERIIAKFQRWAEKKLASAAKATDFVLPEYRDGGRIVTHNKVYDLQIHGRRGKRSSVYLEGDVLKVYLAEGANLRDLVERKIMVDQLPYLKEVLRELNELHFRVNYHEVRFRRVKSRFGSCSSNGNITIAYSLLFAPREVFRYVCVHELAHLKEFNHSARFWAWVESAMPDYEVQERWLKANGMMIS